MNVKFEDPDLEELILTGANKKYKKVSRNQKLMDGLIRVFNLMQDVPNVSMLRIFSYLHYEQLRHNYSGCSSVRIVNGQIERLIFREEDNGITVILITLDDMHYGNK